MKKVLFALAPWLLTAFSYQAMAQDDVFTTKEDKKEAQEIIIRKKGNKDAKIIIDMSGDKVTINGKPLVEFKDDAITINKRNVIVRKNGQNVFSTEGDFFHDFSWGEGQGKTYPFLGVTTDKTDDGAKITDITEESGADKAGLKEGDVITKIGDTKIDGPESLSKAIREKKAKDEVKITYKREGKEKTAKATLQERKDANVFSFSGPDGSVRALTVPGQQLGELRGQLDAISSMPRGYSYNFNDDSPYRVSGFPRQKLGLRIQDTEEGNGVKVLDVEENSAAGKAGLKKDDVVTEIAGVKVNNTDDAREQFHENLEKSSYTIKAKRNGTEMSFDIKIPKKLKTANL